MRLKPLALALLLGGTMIVPALAQPATTPRPTTPATTAAPPVAPPATTTTAAPPISTAPKTTAATTAPAATPVGPLTNINTASAADLDKLPQIGKARAAAIIKGRPYKTTDELLSRKIIPSNAFGKIKGMITTG